MESHQYSIQKKAKHFIDTRQRTVKRLPLWQRSGVVSQQLLRLRRLTFVKRVPKSRFEFVSFLFLGCFSINCKTLVAVGKKLINTRPEIHAHNPNARQIKTFVNQQKCRCSSTVWMPSKEKNSCWEKVLQIDTSLAEEGQERSPPTAMFRPSDE